MNPRTQVPLQAQSGAALRLGQCRASPWLTAPAAGLHRRPARRLRRTAPSALAGDGSDGTVVCLGEALFGVHAGCRPPARCLATASCSLTLCGARQTAWQRRRGSRGSRSPAGALEQVCCRAPAALHDQARVPACACLAGPPSLAAHQPMWQQHWPSWACGWRL